MDMSIGHWVAEILQGRRPGYALVLSGLQGCGKGLLARALATYCGKQLADANRLLPAVLDNKILLYGNGTSDGNLDEAKHAVVFTSAAGVIVEAGPGFTVPADSRRFLVVSLPRVCKPGPRNGGRILAELLAKNLDAWPSFATRAQASHLTVAGVAVNFYDGDKFVSRRDVEASGGYGGVQYGDSCTYTEYLQVLSPPPAEDNQTRRMGAGQRNGGRILARALSSWPDCATEAVVSHRDPETEAMVVNFYGGFTIVNKTLVAGALQPGDRVTRTEWKAWRLSTEFMRPAPVQPFLKTAANHALREMSKRVTESLRRPPPTHPPVILQADGYGVLAGVLARAFDQSATGKGKDRHVSGDGQAFGDQPICEMQRLYGPGYAYGQVGKKMEEAQRLPRDQAVAKLLGGIVYLAAAVIVLEEDSH